MPITFFYAYENIVKEHISRYFIIYLLLNKQRKLI